MKVFPLKRTAGLTRGYEPGAERQHARSFAGMAFFAASGPLGTVCGGCEHYGKAYQRTRNEAGELKTQHRPHACAKHQQLMGGRLGPDIPASTESCRYFQPKSGQ